MTMVVCASGPDVGWVVVERGRPSAFTWQGRMNKLERMGVSASSSKKGGVFESLKESTARGWWWKQLSRSSKEDVKKERAAAVVASSGGDMDIDWGDIVNPTPENLLALLLTGLLGLAILQIFWQLLLVAITITLAALKYSVIAAILLALLIVFL